MGFPGGRHIKLGDDGKRIGPGEGRKVNGGKLIGLRPSANPGEGGEMSAGGERGIGACVLTIFKKKMAQKRSKWTKVRQQAADSKEGGNWMWTVGLKYVISGRIG